MAVSKVIYGGETLIDLTSDTVTANDLAEGVTATAADGTQITGLLPKVDIDDALSSTSTNPVQNKVINAALNSKADSSMLSAYLPLAGGTCTGGVSAPNFQTGTGETNYFQCRKFRGEGDANTYYHAVDFGYKGHDSVDFYEYNPNWNFHKCTSGTKSSAVLVGSINGNGWNGGAVLSGTPTAPTATAGTNTTQIATTAFVQTAVSSKVDTSALATVATSGSYSDLTDTPTIPTVPTTVSSFTNDAGYLTSHQDISGKADKATTLAGYGITDAKIASGTITLGSNSITPLTSHQSLAAYAKTADLASVATSGSYEDLTNKPTIPDVSEYAKTSVANTWSAWQKLQYIDIGVERYTTTIYSGTSHTPATSDCIYTATGAFTLDMSTLAGQLDNSTSMVFSATFSASSDYTLTISNAGTLKYLGSASDLAITSAGLLLNIKMCKDASGNLTSYVQGVSVVG